MEGERERELERGSREVMEKRMPLLWRDAGGKVRKIDDGSRALNRSRVQDTQIGPTESAGTGTGRSGHITRKRTDLPMSTMPYRWLVSEVSISAFGEVTYLDI